MKTLEGFCNFMEEYLGEAVHYRGGRSPEERLNVASNKNYGAFSLGMDRVRDSEHNTSASQSKKERETGYSLQKSANKATVKINDLRAAERKRRAARDADFGDSGANYTDPKDFTLKGR